MSTRKQQRCCLSEQMKLYFVKADCLLLIDVNFKCSHNIQIDIMESQLPGDALMSHKMTEGSTFDFIFSHLLFVFCK